MDIQFAYNVERMLYYMCNENPIALKGIMDQVDRQFSYLPGATGAHLDPLLVRRIQETFSAVSVSDADTLSTMRDFKLKYHFSLCPHSAIAVHAALTTFKEAARADPMVCVLTAHPAKVS
jgi:threonine synthase